MFFRKTKKLLGQPPKKSLESQNQDIMSDLFEKITSLPVCLETDSNGSHIREFWNTQNGIIITETSRANQKFYHMFSGTHHSTLTPERMEQILLVWTRVSSSIDFSDFPQNAKILDTNKAESNPMEIQSNVVSLISKRQ